MLKKKMAEIHRGFVQARIEHIHDVAQISH